MKYDPDIGPDVAQWLQVSEDERLEAVISWMTGIVYPDTEIDMTNAIALVALETHIACEEPAFVAATLTRLTSEGLDRFKAIASMVEVFTEQLYKVKNRYRSLDMQAYQRGLCALHAEQIKAAAAHDMQGPPPPFDPHLQERLETFAGRHAQQLSYPAMAGQMFAMLCGPRSWAPSEWMPLVLGDVKLNSKSEAREITEALLSLSHWIMGTARWEGGDPIPVDCAPDPDPMANLQEGSRFGQWCMGWTKGLMVCHADWSAGLTSCEQEHALRSIVATLSFFTSRTLAADIYAGITEPEQPTSLEDLADGLHRQIPDVVAGYIALSREARDMLARSPRSAQLPVRSSKVGRNEHCPCGSGKKYKKCCGG